MKLQIAADTWVWAVFALYLVLLYYPTIREIIGIGYLVDKGQ